MPANPSGTETTGPRNALSSAIMRQGCSRTGQLLLSKPPVALNHNRSAASFRGFLWQGRDRRHADARLGPDRARRHRAGRRRDRQVAQRSWSVFKHGRGV